MSYFIVSIRASNRSIARSKEKIREIEAQEEADRDQEIAEAYERVKAAEQELRVCGMVVDHLALKEADAIQALAEFDAKQAAKRK